MLSLQQIPIKNIKAHPVRSGILAFLVIIQVLCVILGAFAVQQVRDELSLAEARLGADILIYPTQAMSKISKDSLLMQGSPVSVYKSLSMLSRLEDCENIAAISRQIYISCTDRDGKTTRITGYEPETDFVISPWIREGTAFMPADGELIIGADVVASEDSALQLFGRDWPVSGHLLKTGSELDQMVFVNMNTLRLLIDASVDAGIQSYAKIDPDTTFSAMTVRVDDKQYVESVTNWINIYIRKVTAIRSENSLSSTAENLQGQIRTIAVIAISAWILLTGALVIVQAMLMKERKNEFSVWHAIGAAENVCGKVVIREAALIYLVGTVCGIIVSAAAIILLGLQPSGIKNINWILFFILLLTGFLVNGLSARLFNRNVMKTLSGQSLLNL